MRAQAILLLSVGIGFFVFAFAEYAQEAGPREPMPVTVSELQAKGAPSNPYVRITDGVMEGNKGVRLTAKGRFGGVTGVIQFIPVVSRPAPGGPSSLVAIVEMSTGDRPMFTFGAGGPEAVTGLRVRTWRGLPAGVANLFVPTYGKEAVRAARIYESLRSPVGPQLAYTLMVPGVLACAGAVVLLLKARSAAGRAGTPLPAR